MYNTISRWIVEAIKSAGPDALISATLRAHDTRGLSTSWALFNGASLDQITRAAYWSNSNSFITCYLRDVVSLEASFGLASLGASAFARSNPLGSGRSTSHLFFVILPPILVGGPFCANLARLRSIYG